MSKRQNISVPYILAIAERQEFFVSRYKWSHDRLRKKCRRLRTDGKLVIAHQDKDGWYYRAAPTATPPAP